MFFIAKNPLSIPEINQTPSTLPGTRGLFAKEDGWYSVDEEGNEQKISTKEEVEAYIEETILGGAW